MTILIDVILVLIIAIAAYIGFRKGIVKMLLSFLVIILALVCSWGISSPLANVGYSMFFEQSVSQTVDAALENAKQDAVDEAVEKLFDSGSILGGIGSLVGFDTESVVDSVAGDSLEKVAVTLKEDVIKPPTVLLLRCIVFVLLFILLWIKRLTIFFVSLSFCPTNFIFCYSNCILNMIGISISYNKLENVIIVS